MSRAAVFIDGGYLEILQKYEQQSRVDLLRLVEESKSSLNLDGCELVRSYYYCCPSYVSDPPTEDELDRRSKYRRFEDAVRYLPRFEVRTGTLRKIATGENSEPVFEQKQVDLLLGLDLAIMSIKHLIDHAVLVAGDEDFVPALEVAKAEGVTIHLVHGPKLGRHGHPTYSAELFRAADVRIELFKDIPLSSIIRRGDLRSF